MAVTPAMLAKHAKLLAHPLRLEILRILIARHKACGVKDLIHLLAEEEGREVLQPAVSIGLRDLATIGLVERQNKKYIAKPRALSALLGELGSYTGITQANDVEYQSPGEN